MERTAATVEPVQYNTRDWVEENQKFFLPPVCNKMMHNDQLKCFFVGGPNQRKDFHLEEGEELFYMRKGDMSLPILTEGRIRTVHIREGEVFLLPGRIPHSPQREKQTVGLVIERERLRSETDGLRYFVGDTTEVLFERWFYCEDLGSQLKPVIEEFFASKECRTGRPGPGSLHPNPPWQPDTVTKVESPFSLSGWLERHRADIQQSGSRHLFPPGRYQSDITVLGRGVGARTLPPANTERFLWQLEGETAVRLQGGRLFRLQQDDTLRIPGGEEVTFSPQPHSLTLSVVMDPANKPGPANNT